MNENEKHAIEKMAKILDEADRKKFNSHCDLPSSEEYATDLYNAGYRKQIEGEWEWFEEWSPSTTEHPRECDECGWRCGKCKTVLADIVGGYWDDPDEKPNLNFCPDCGAKMKGGAE